MTSTSNVGGSNGLRSDPLRDDPPSPYGGLAQPDALPGTLLAIPVATPRLDFSHRVTAGETVDSIAQRYGVDPNAIRAANPDLLRPANVTALDGPLQTAQPWAGTPLTIPASNPRFVMSHTVMPGETIESIAKDYGVRPEDLRSANQVSLELQQTSLTAANQPVAAQPQDLSFSRVRYHTTYGPKHAGSVPLKDYAGWDNLIQRGVVTSTDKTIISALSRNEGNLDALQSYDDQAVTAGAMQKTVNDSGTGELSTQVAKFKAAHPDQYKTLFEDKGWTVEGTGAAAKLYYSPDGKGDDKVTGASLKTYLRDDFAASYKTAREADTQRVADARAHHLKATPVKNLPVESKPLGALVDAIRSPAFQDLQIRDFKTRLDSAVGQSPTGYSGAISDYVTSNLGRATVLDQSVNRPGYVASDFAKALDRFYDRHPEASKDPAQWGKNHDSYESEIVADYGTTRRGTDMPARFGRLKSELSP